MMLVNVFLRTIVYSISLEVARSLMAWFSLRACLYNNILSKLSGGSEAI
jgi:hypothetical protein